MTARETEYAVRQVDDLEGQQIHPMPTLATALERVRYLERISSTRHTYFITAEVVERTSEDGPWRAVSKDEVRSRMDAAWDALGHTVDRIVAASQVRFGLSVDSVNTAHVRFRLFAATGGQHLGGCGALVMGVEEFAAFRQLLEPMLTDRSDAPSDQA